MESTRRTLAKTCTWQVSGLIVMTLVSYAVTGSFIQGGAVALIGAAIGAFSYAIHERLWARVRWGRLNRR